MDEQEESDLLYIELDKVINSIFVSLSYGIQTEPTIYLQSILDRIDALHPNDRIMLFQSFDPATNCIDNTFTSKNVMILANEYARKMSDKEHEQDPTPNTFGQDISSISEIEFMCANLFGRFINKKAIKKDLRIKLKRKAENERRLRRLMGA